MVNPGTGRDDTKYLSMTVAMTAYLEANEAGAGFRERAIARLVAAVEADSRRRGTCRDTDVASATRQRVWSVS